ncbi:T7SS effector LXG polymorphic toxin [Metabacillus sp. 113a]|uniref:T7SS effector LXG polymorphic toxin n=1 Tax=Metabacillus sp. 113a TaxID=3404706 RepID=UPI003CEE34FE
MEKIYDADKLTSAMEERKKLYSDLDEKLTDLKGKMGMLADNGEFQGKGADNIKSFFQAHMALVSDWKNLIEFLTSFLESIPKHMSDYTIGEGTRVTVPFLEEQLESGSKKSNDLVAAQQEDIAKILEGIQDLVPLTAFSTETFDEKMKKADEKRAETVEAVNTLDDQVMTPAYTDGVTKAMMTIQIGYGAIIEATVQGGTAQPMNFSVEAYKKHDVHDARERMDEYINAFQYREKKADEVRAEIAAEKARIAEEQARIEAEKNKPWYEKAWEGTKVFAGEVSGYNDTVRATTGVDPVTGRKLSEAERVAAGAMAAAGFIPVVGWAGRAIKGGAAIVKTAKTMNAATHSLDAYKTTKGMEILSKTEKGIYGLYTGNSAWEFGTGTDMFGNQLTEEQRMNSLWGGLTMGAAGGAAHIIDKGGLRKLADKAPYSTAYVKEQTGKANQTLKQMGNRVGSKAEDALRSSANAANKLATHTKGAVNQVTKKMANINVPSSVRVYSMDANGVRIPVVDVEKKRLGDMIEGMNSGKIDNEFSGSKTSTARNIDQIDYGAYLRKNKGAPPEDMYDPHAHHIVFKKGNGKEQKELVKEGQEILIEYDIDPISGLENLVWAPNRVKGQHGIEALRNVVENIKKVKDAGGDRDDMVEMLEKLGDIAKRRK